MARKDRERARKRHAIERARRESGFEPAPKEDRPAANEAEPEAPAPTLSEADSRYIWNAIREEESDGY